MPQVTLPFGPFEDIHSLEPEEWSQGDWMRETAIGEIDVQALRVETQLGMSLEL